MRKTFANRPARGLLARKALLTSTLGLLLWACSSSGAACPKGHHIDRASDSCAPDSQDSGLDASDVEDAADGGLDRDAQQTGPSEAGLADAPISANEEAGSPEAGSPDGSAPAAYQLVGHGLRPYVAASAQTGRAIVLWEVHRPAGDGETSDIWYSMRAPGGTWSEKQQLSLPGRADVEADHDVRAVVDALGNVTVIWRRNDKVISRRWIVNSMSWDKERNAGGWLTTSSAPNMLQGTGPGPTAFWSFNGQAIFSYYAPEYEGNESNQPWNPAGNMHIDGGVGDEPVAVAPASDGYVAIAMLPNAVATARSELWVREAGIGGAPVELLAHTVAAGGSLPKALAIASTGLHEYFVMWHETDPANVSNIGMAVRLPPADDFTVTKPFAGHNAHLISRPPRGFVMVWSDQTLKSRTFDGSAFSEIRPLGGTAVPQLEDDVGFVGDPAGAMFAAWVEQSGAELLLKVGSVRATGSWNAPRTLASLGNASSLSTEGHPVIAAAKDGTALVTYATQGEVRVVAIEAP